MSKKIIILNIVGMVIVGLGVIYFFAWRPQEKSVDVPREEAEGIYFNSNIDIGIPEHPGMNFVMEYRRGVLVAHYYIAKEKQSNLIDFFKNELDNFEVAEDISVSNARYFYMSNKKMMAYDSEGDYDDQHDLIEAHEEFKEGELMTVEVGRAPVNPGFDYIDFNPMRPGQRELEETMVVFWFYSPNI